jgi:integrase
MAKRSGEAANLAGKAQEQSGPLLGREWHTGYSPDFTKSGHEPNEIWNDVYRSAQVEGKTPHSARHAMGQHIMAKTGNIAAVQRQLGHRHAAYSMQYARVSDQQLAKVLDDR